MNQRHSNNIVNTKLFFIVYVPCTFLVVLFIFSFLFLRESFRFYPVLIIHNPDLTIEEIKISFDRESFKYYMKGIKILTLIPNVPGSGVIYEIKSKSNVYKDDIYTESLGKFSIMQGDKNDVEIGNLSYKEMIYYYNKRGSVLSEKLVDDKKVVEVEYFDDTVNRNFN